jgi:rhodanese-related sulfurtransferase
MPVEIRRKDVKTLSGAGRTQLVDVHRASEYNKEQLPHAVNVVQKNAQLRSSVA